MLKRFYKVIMMESFAVFHDTNTRWRLKSPVFRLFAQPFVQAQIKENINVPRHSPL